MSKKVTIHVLSELDPACLVSNHSKSAPSRSIKSLVGVPLVLTAAKLIGKTEESQGYRVTAHLADDDAEFSVLVFSQQPKQVISAILEADLWPMSATFSKVGGRYLVSQPA